MVAHWPKKLDGSCKLHKLEIESLFSYLAKPFHASYFFKPVE
jgi:hypothetical protein